MKRAQQYAHDVKGYVYVTIFMDYSLKWQKNY